MKVTPYRAYLEILRPMSHRLAAETLPSKFRPKTGRSGHPDDKLAQGSDKTVSA
jgi:hypothetical protein